VDAPILFLNKVIEFRIEEADDLRRLVIDNFLTFFVIQYRHCISKIIARIHRLINGLGVREIVDGLSRATFFLRSKIPPTFTQLVSRDGNVYSA
jgi:hypothetical protein